MEALEAIIVTPSANDSQVAVSLLQEAGITARACATLGELSASAVVEVGCAILVDEALVHPEIDAFLANLAEQPTWSDLPLVLIGSRDTALGALVESLFPQSGNLAVLERPMNPVSLVAAVRVGLRARERQFQVRGLIDQRERALRQREEFLAMLSHELRNPLAPMRNAIYLMKSLDIDSTMFVKARELIDRQIVHMSRLIDDLMDVSRLELGKMQLQMRAIDLNAAIVSATDACLSLINARGHTLEVSLATEPLLVRADPLRLEQIICNLVTNAAKFTAERGTIAVEASGDSGSACVSVRDSGVGIESDMLGAVFDLFTQDAATLERSAGGLGIGLTIVKRLVELHGGTIRVASEGRGRGAQFTVRLPRQPASAEAAESGGDQETSVHGGRRVLVIEDNPDIRESLGLLLTAWGHGVEYAESGTAGLSRAGEVQPDVALVDVGLPGLNGYEVAQHIRKLDTPWSRQVKLVALTGYGRDADRERAIASGFDHHLVKPVDPDVLAEVLRTL